MKNIFKQGDIKEHTILVTLTDIARFETGVVHEVYSTFSIARDAEWVGRLFVLDMLEPLEQGIGTSIEVQHLSPAFIGETVKFIGVLEKIEANKIYTKFTATVHNRLIAKGTQTQRIMLQSAIDKHFEDVQKS